MIVFGFPHCGEVSQSYLGWSERLHGNVTFRRVALSEAGLSMREVSSDLWEQALQEACRYIKQQLLLQGSDDFIFVGHCWGSLLAFEACHRLKAEGFPEPLHVFLSGCNAPHLLRLRGGIRLHGELLQPDDYHCEPSEDYRFAFDREPLQARISVFVAIKDEHVYVDRLAEWSRYTAQICDVHLFEGDHTNWQSDSMKYLQLAQTIVEREHLTEGVFLKGVMPG